ncbi:MAG: hypothetical protein LBJ25_04645 [Candidatus Margulisbacteria bacterium]|jgi:hypothetical protein|nr:hypothetical protein [Candidatus Margulisiibacteriota bacterium]
MLWQTKIISSGFEKIEIAGLSTRIILSSSGSFITYIKLPGGTSFRLGSAFDPKYPKDVNSSSNTNTIAAKLGCGIGVLDLNTIFLHTGILSQDIYYVLGGVNLFYQKGDSVFYQNVLKRKPVPRGSLWYGQPLYFFMQDTSGHFSIDSLAPDSEESFLPNLNIAVSGRPVLLDGTKLDLYTPLTNNGLSPAEYFFLEDGRDARHLVKLPHVKDKEGEKHFLGMEYFSQKPEQLLRARQGLASTIPYKEGLFNKDDLESGLYACYPDSRRWELDLKHSKIYFPYGLDKNIYSHNVLAVDWSGNAYLLQFHGKSGQEGVTIEQLQNKLQDLKIRSAIVTSNGLDVFVYDARHNKYFSCSRKLDDVLAQKDRPAQHLLIVHE